MNNKAVKAFELISADKKVLKELLSLIDDLGWDYDRMSRSGKNAYSKIVILLDMEDLIRAIE